MDCIGWLSPYGTLFECNNHAHLDKAREMVKALCATRAGEEPDETLIRLGFIRISRITYGDVGLMFWMPEIITEYQRIAIEDIAYEHLDECSEKALQVLKEYRIID